jgi:hypothetical protein
MALRNSGSHSVAAIDPAPSRPGDLAGVDTHTHDVQLVELCPGCDQDGCIGVQRVLDRGSAPEPVLLVNGVLPHLKHGGCFDHIRNKTRP